MFYKKGIDISNTKQMFEFLKGHYTYDTMSSWNGLKSIANNVKLYNLNLDGDYHTALRFLEDEEYFTVNQMIEYWEYGHKGYQVGFNGRSGGYLVLYSEHSNGNILPDVITDACDYKAFKEDCDYYYGGVKYYKSELREYTKLVQDFDKLCDNIRDYVNTLSLRSFVDDKINYLLDDFAYDYEEEFKTLNAKLPKIKLATDDLIEIMIDETMRKYKSLMNCFIYFIKSEYWSIIDTGTVIRVEVC